MDFMEKLRQPRPDPGGGAAAAYAGLIATALLEKILRLETARNPASGMPDTLEHLKLLETELCRLQQKDVEAYLNFVQARSIKDDEVRLEGAKAELTNCPLNILRTADQLMDIAAKVGASCARHLLPDVLVCCELLSACARGAAHIVEANLLNYGCLENGVSEELKRVEIRMEQVTRRLEGRFN